MGSKLRRADRIATKRYEEDDDFVVCRTELTRGEMNELFRYFPTNIETRDSADGKAPRVDREAAAQGIVFMEHFFELVVKQWSLEDLDGTAMAVTVENYRELTFEGAKFVDDILNKHLQEMMNQNNAEGESIP